MIKVEVLFFARLRELFGTNSLVLDVEESQTVAEMALHLIESRPELASVPMRFAVNDEFVDGQRVLRDGDVVAVVHPVSGG